MTIERAIVICILTLLALLVLVFVFRLLGAAV